MFLCIHPNAEDSLSQYIAEAGTISPYRKKNL